MNCNFPGAKGLLVGASPSGWDDDKLNLARIIFIISPELKNMRRMFIHLITVKVKPWKANRNTRIFLVKCLQN